jgi:hypothetical protein
MVKGNGDELHWVPTAGDFDITPDRIIFRGREFVPQPSSPATAPNDQAPAPQALAGLVVSNRFATDGRLRARVSFEQLGPATTFEFVLYRDRDRRHFVSAGLGGSEWAFAIREFAPPDVPVIDNNTINMWKVHRGEGMRSFLKAGQEYDVEVRLVAGQITLLVDSVPVLSTKVPALHGSPMQVGVFCLSFHHIAISNIEAQLQRPKAFVVMQFDGAFDELYHHVIREICEEFDVSPLKADDMVGPGVIMEDIIREIQSARLIVADITPANPNVYFEVGYARALGKPIILLAQKGTRLPFDVAGFRVLFYEDSIGGKARLDESLRKHVAEVLG